MYIWIQADWGYIDKAEFPTEVICRYKYYIKGSEEFKLLRFFYDSSNHEQKSTLKIILEILLVYENEL